MNVNAQAGMKELNLLRTKFIWSHLLSKANLVDCNQFFQPIRTEIYNNFLVAKKYLLKFDV